MTPKTPYIIPLVFLFILAGPFVVLSGLQVFRVYTTCRMQTALKREKLQTLRFPAAKVQWVEDEREILVDGKMYDIKSHSIKDGIFTAKGIYDEDETGIVNFLSGPVTGKQQTYYILQMLLLTQCFVAMVRYSVSFYIPSFIKKVYKELLLNYLSPCFVFEGPPPKMKYFFF